MWHKTFSQFCLNTADAKVEKLSVMDQEPPAAVHRLSSASTYCWIKAEWCKFSSEGKATAERWAMHLPPYFEQLWLIMAPWSVSHTGLLRALNWFWLWAEQHFTQEHFKADCSRQKWVSLDLSQLAYELKLRYTRWVLFLFWVGLQ